MSGEIPAGYDKTGRTMHRHAVCCLSKDFIPFTAGINTSHLGFAVVDGELVPLAEYHNQSAPTEAADRY